MKHFAIGIIILLISFTGYSQQKISGTVLYFFNDAQGNKADAGADIYILPEKADSSIDYNALDSVIEMEHFYTAYLQLKSMGGMMKEYQDKMDEWGLTNDDTLKDLIGRGTIAEIRHQTNSKVYKQKADGVGNYTQNLKKPGYYYVLIKSANRNGVTAASESGKLYLEKIFLDIGDEKNVSTIFRIY